MDAPIADGASRQTRAPRLPPRARARRAQHLKWRIALLNKNNILPHALAPGFLLPPAQRPPLVWNDKELSIDLGPKATNFVPTSATCGPVVPVLFSWGVRGPRPGVVRRGPPRRVMLAGSIFARLRCVRPHSAKMLCIGTGQLVRICAGSQKKRGKHQIGGTEPLEGAACSTSQAPELRPLARR